MGLFRIIIASLVVEDIVIWWLGARWLRKIPVWRGVRLVFHGFLAFQAASLSATLYARTHDLNLDAVMPTPVWTIMLIWHLLVAPVVLVVTLLGVVGEGASVAIRLLAARFRRQPALADAYPNPAGLTRRAFLGTAAALTPPVFTLALSAVAAGQLSQFRIRHMALSLPGLPRSLDGLTIAHLSDTHLGRFTHGAVVRKVVDSTNALKADLVLFTGDLINDMLEWLPEGIQMLRSIDSPLVLCEGNHDLIVNPREFEERVKASGLALLVNEATTIPVRGAPVQLLGLRWGGPPNYGRRRHDEHLLAASMNELLRLRDPDAFPILMAHHPHAWDYAGDLPLTLSGHTHGGQLMVNERLGCGPAMFRYWSGLYTRGTQSLVVSNGVGNWFPIRTAAPAEIIHLTLRRG